MHTWFLSRLMIFSVISGFWKMEKTENSSKLSTFSKNYFSLIFKTWISELIKLGLPENRQSSWNWRSSTASWISGRIESSKMHFLWLLSGRSFRNVSCVANSATLSQIHDTVWKRDLLHSLIYYYCLRARFIYSLRTWSTTTPGDG